MNITEQNIFDFVFLPYNLSDKQIEQINNTKEIDELIKFYQSLKHNLLSEISIKEKMKLVESIPFYQPQLTFSLKPIHVNESPKKIKELLHNGSKQIIKTFQDKEKLFLIRSYFDGNQTTLSLFPNLFELFKTIKLIIKPENKIFLFSKNISNCDVGLTNEIEQIELELIK